MYIKKRNRTDQIIQASLAAEERAIYNINKNSYCQCLRNSTPTSNINIFLEINFCKNAVENVHASFLLSAFYFDLVQFDFFEFPHSYICLCFLFALAEEKYITVQSYSGQGKDEIAFEKGVIVEVIQKNLEGWWFVRYTFHPLLWAHSFWFFFFTFFPRK